ncbi:T9SS type A sorting domain-containing protein [bacterium SCSIO 12741]|nr:T9SS type A sorting domain-containing protein [bacterium SCSIO 12741]
MRFIYSFGVALLFSLLLCHSSYSQIIVHSYVESFDNPSTPIGWTNTNNYGNSHPNSFWKYNDSLRQNTNVHDHTGNGGHFAWVDGSYPYPIICTLQSDSMDLSKADSVFLELWHVSYNVTFQTGGHNAFYIDFFDGKRWNQNVHVFAGNYSNQQWHKISLDLTPFPISRNKKAVLRISVNKNASTPYYHDHLIDDIKVTGISYSNGQNNAALHYHTLPQPICKGNNDIGVKISNRGRNQMDSVQVHWTVNGVTQPMIHLRSLLDTLGGNLPNDTLLHLGNINFPADSLIHLKIWTSLPNGVVDSINDNDTLTFSIRPGLEGKYTVGGSNLDFDSIVEAVDILNLWGVCGPVTFELTDTVHYARPVIKDYPGSAPSKLVTFTSKSKNHNLCSIEFQSTGSNDNGTIEFDQTSNLLFSHIGIRNRNTSIWAMVGTFKNKSQNISFHNCHISSASSFQDPATASLLHVAYPHEIENLSIDSSTFTNGASAIYLSGNIGKLNKDLTIKSSTFTNQNNNPIDIQYSRRVIIEQNQITSNANQAIQMGIQLNRVRDSLWVVGNTIQNMHRGIWVRFASGKAGQLNLIANNVLTSGYNHTRTNPIIGLDIDSVSFTQIYHNTVAIKGNHSQSNCLYINKGAGLRIHNNNLVNDSLGNIVYLDQSTSIASMNHNNYYDPFNPTLKFGANTISSMATWRFLTGIDSNSTFTDPQFSPPQNLRPCSPQLDNRANSNHSIAFDQTLVNRDPNHPDVGAYEFISLNNFHIADGWICPGDTYTFAPSIRPKDTLLWNSSLQSHQFQSAQPGNYFVDYSSACGSIRQYFSLHESPKIELGPDTHLCAGLSWIIQPNVATGQFLWNDGTQNRTQLVTKPGVYEVSLIDTLGCSSADTVEVTYSKTLKLRSDTAVCPGQSVVLNPKQGPGGYQWTLNGQAIDTNHQINADQQGTYRLQHLDPYGCTSSDDFILTHLKAHQALFTTSQSQNQVQFTAQDKSASNYAWSFGDGQTASGTSWQTLHTYQQPGTHDYVVTLTVSSQRCGDSSHTDTVSIIGVGWEDLNSGNLSARVYPNPSSGELNIELQSDLSQQWELRLTDIQGKQILKNTLYQNAPKEVFQPAVQLETGTYILYLSPEKGEPKTVRLVVH